MPPQFQNNIPPVVTPNPPENTYQGKKSKKWIWILVAVVLLATLAFIFSPVDKCGCGLPLWWPIKCKCNIKPPPTDQFSDWKTYRNDEYGFEFKYPSNFIVDQINSEKIWFWDEQTDPKCNEATMDCIKSIKTFGFSIEIQKAKDNNLNQAYEISFIKDDTLFSVISGDLIKMNQILSTFKFTK